MIFFNLKQNPTTNFDFLQRSLTPSLLPHTEIHRHNHTQKHFQMDRGESSSDSEQDTQTLIPEKSPKRPSSIFNIDTTHQTHKGTFINYINCITSLPIKKRYILLFTFTLFIILVLYFTTNLKRTIFSTNVVGIDSNLVSRMREDELKVLSLLRKQQSGLFKLWNLTNGLNSTNEDAKSYVLSQISLNKQIEQVLLSNHELGSGDFGGIGDNVTDPFMGMKNLCGKVGKVEGRKTIEWKPEEGKYLFATCVSGQMSNHLICLEKHMFFAALLNRVLVIPSAKVDYQFNRVLDIEHINECLGRKVVVTFEEFAEAKKSHLHIDKFICYFSKPNLCFLDDDHVKKLKSLGLSMNKLEPAWVEDVKNPSKRTMQDVVSRFSSKDDVIAIGDVFFADVERDMVMQPGGPLAHKCKTLIEPSRLIMLTAQRFVQTFLGENFIALHFRRHGFLKFCNAKSPSCFFPIPQAADCITRLVEKANTPVIYLSTDAAESETNLLQSLIVLNGKMVPLVKRPARNSAEKWDALLYRHGIEGDPQVEAMLDKTICAMSSVFIGAPGSTFTEDILRLRKDWGSGSICDEYLCQGEVPNFIADNE